jgi:hypothetical protein
MYKTPRTDDIALYIKGGTVMYGKRLDDDCGEVVPCTCGLDAFLGEPHG